MKQATSIYTIMLVVSVVFFIEGCGRTVSPGEKGLRWRPYTVGLDKDPLGAGFHFKAPWNKVFVYNVKWQSFTEKVDALSADDLPVSLHAALTIRPLADEVWRAGEQRTGRDVLLDERGDRRRVGHAGPPNCCGRHQLE
jgi:regulator of protease activity HflC (stomatin/prohibitin superfamily)